MQRDAETLKDILIETVAGNHPDGPFDISELEFRNCRRFLRHFIGEGKKGHVFTLNYDLLLYWTLMHEDVPEGTEPIVLAKK